MHKCRRVAPLHPAGAFASFNRTSSPALFCGQARRRMMRPGKILRESWRLFTACGHRAGRWGRASCGGGGGTSLLGVWEGKPRPCGEWERKMGAETVVAVGPTTVLDVCDDCLAPLREASPVDFYVGSGASEPPFSSCARPRVCVCSVPPLFFYRVCFASGPSAHARSPAQSPRPPPLSWDSGAFFGAHGAAGEHAAGRSRPRPRANLLRHPPPFCAGA